MDRPIVIADIVDLHTALRIVYDDSGFRAFATRVTSQAELHPYANPLSSLDLHQADRG